jgi:D-serine deaminase-like pyridoxal phosphate-dependent protein
MHIHDLDTPALLIDLDVMERNLRRVADYSGGHGLGLRPHIKTHKIPELARRQLALGARGITVAKVGEAEVMLEALPPEMLVAYPVIGESKLRRLMEVARRTRLLIALDDLEVARPVSHAAAAAGVEVGVLAEVDVGLRRVGVAPAHVDTLAREIARLPGLTVEGITFYPGHVKAVDAEGLDALKNLSHTVGAMANGYKIVSGGSTPLLYHSHEVRGLTEIRPGTYIFNDRNTVRAGACERADCAVTILATVVSRACPGQMIVDGGSKTFSSDRLSTGDDNTYGEVVEAPQARFHRLNEEHGYVALDHGENFRIGDRVHIVPNHVCVAINLHERVYGVRGETVEEVWPVKARGKLQ